MLYKIHLVNMTLTMSFVRCLLCQGALPPTQDEAVTEHFQDQHRAYFNIDFLFKSSFLDENEISRTLDFMLSIVSNTNVEKEHDANIFWSPMEVIGVKRTFLDLDPL